MCKGVGGAGGEDKHPRSISCPGPAGGVGCYVQCKGMWAASIAAQFLSVIGSVIGTVRHKLKHGWVHSMMRHPLIHNINGATAYTRATAAPLTHFATIRHSGANYVLLLPPGGSGLSTGFLPAAMLHLQAEGKP